jgi:hypothetical protein
MDAILTREGRERPSVAEPNRPGLGGKSHHTAVEYVQPLLAVLQVSSFVRQPHNTPLSPTSANVMPVDFLRAPVAQWDSSSDQRPSNLKLEGASMDKKAVSAVGH